MKSKIKVGDTVDYHSFIGREITSTGHVVTALYPKPNNFGRDCAMVSGKYGVVAVAALTPSPSNAEGESRAASARTLHPLVRHSDSGGEA